MAKTLTHLEKIITKIKTQGHRMTPQRMAILKILIDNPNHPTVGQIHAEVIKDFPMTSLATTYKMVNLLKGMGEIFEIDHGDDKVHYDGRSSAPHPHIICTHCHNIKDLDPHALFNIEELPKEVAKSTGYHITHFKFDFFGICPKCQEKEL